MSKEQKSGHDLRVGGPSFHVGAPTLGIVETPKKEDDKKSDEKPQQSSNDKE